MGAWTYSAQRALTGTWLDKNLPLRGARPQWALSAAGSLSGTLGPDVAALSGPDGRPLIEEWGTYLYAETDGQVRWGGVVVSAKYAGDDLVVEAAGFTTYPFGQGWDDAIEVLGASPYQVIQTVWSTLQARPDGDLGVDVVTHGDPPLRLGTPGFVENVPPRESGEPPPAPEGETPEQAEVRLRDYMPTARVVEDDPYRFHWADGVKDCGAEITALCEQAGVDYLEHHEWDGENVAHRVDLHYPRLGRWRPDLTFSDALNITSLVAPEADGDAYANEVLGVGAGEGEAVVRANAANRDGRLRRAFVYVDKAATDPDRLRAQVRAELAERQNVLDVTSITVRDTVSAPLGSWDLGDTVEITATLPWLGRFTLRSRIVAWSLDDVDTATLTLVRADRFTYGAGGAS